MIVQMPDHHRMRLLNIAIKMSEGLSYNTTYGRERRNRRSRSNSLMGVFVGFVLGFIFAIFFIMSMDYLPELLMPPI